MPHSFFSLTSPQHPHGPNICADCADHLATEPEAEQQANMDAAMALGDTLLEAIDAYTAQHEETSYRHIFEALAYLHWCLQRELDEDAADA